VPLTSKIAAQLEQQGYIIESDCTISDFADKVIEVYSGGKTNAQ